MQLTLRICLDDLFERPFPVNASAKLGYRSMYWLQELGFHQHLTPL